MRLPLPYAAAEPIHNTHQYTLGKGQARGESRGLTGAALVRTGTGVDAPQHTFRHMPALGNLVLARHL
jgi:hypothetical protein